MFGAMMQNNLEAKKYAIEKTNLANDLINLLIKSKNNAEELSAFLFSIGGLVRSNPSASHDVIKKVITVTVEIITRESVPIAQKVKSLLLIEDLIAAGQFEENFIENINLCDSLSEFLANNKNSLIIDADLMEKCAASFLNLGVCDKNWKANGNFRHNLKVLLSNYLTRLVEENDEDLKFIYQLIVEHLQNLEKTLYGDLKIPNDDLVQKEEL
jgi:hypothetical protein